MVKMALEISSYGGCAASPYAGVLRAEDAARQQANTPTGIRLQATDAVELSARLLDVQRTQQIVQESPEVREDLVSNARQALAAGELTLESDVLAEKLISEQLS
jgi:flagellar biosynthesis anti-sigma factor FlgM